MLPSHYYLYLAQKTVGQVAGLLPLGELVVLLQVLEVVTGPPEDLELSDLADLSALLVLMAAC